MSAVVFPDPAVLVLDRLRPIIADQAFHHEVPIPRPDVFIRIYRTGGPRTGLVVDGAQLTVESWAPTVAQAAANAAIVRAHLNALAEERTTPAIYRVDELSGPGELPDPASASRRVTWTVVVLVRGSTDPDLHPST